MLAYISNRKNLIKGFEIKWELF